jgi:hypothetical protein
MSSKEGKRVMGQCTAEQKAATCEEERTLALCTAQHRSATAGERCTTEPMDSTRGDALLKRKAQEEIHPHSEQDTSAREFSIDKILMAAILPKRADVVSVAAAVEATEPVVVDLAKTAVSEPQAEDGIKEAVSEPQAEEGGIQDAVSEPQAEEAEYTDGYEDQTKYDYQDEAEYDDDEAEYDDDEEEDDYDYDSDYEYDYGPLFEEHRPKVREVLLRFPEAANLEPHELDAAVERVLEQSKPENADVAAPGKIRLLSDDIKTALEAWRAPPPTILREDQAYKDRLPADLLARMEELDREFLPLCDKAEEELEQFRAKVRRELIEKGYVEVDEDYYDKKDELERQVMQQVKEEWDQKMYFRRFPVAQNEEGKICYYSEEHGRYI